MIAKLSWTNPVPDVFRGGAVAIGNFDGVHRGHICLLHHLREAATRVPGPAVAVTLDPHPLQLLRPEQFMPVLTTCQDRTALLQQQGADHVLVLHTAADLLQLSPVDFFEQVIRKRLDARALVEGPNFGFGHNREGDIPLLRKLCNDTGLSVQIVSPMLSDGRPVSSSRVRTALENGNVREATSLMGRAYRLRGRVGTGEGRGASLGFPTANLVDTETVVPGDGVYATRVYHDGKLWPGAVNIGPNPTFGQNAHKVEVHLIGFQGSLVGRSLSVEFVARLRDTRRFSSPQALVEQLHADVEEARRLAGEARESSCPQT